LVWTSLNIHEKQNKKKREREKSKFNKKLIVKYQQIKESFMIRRLGYSMVKR